MGALLSLAGSTHHTVQLDLGIMMKLLHHLAISSTASVLVYDVIAAFSNSFKWFLEDVCYMH